MGEIIDFEDGMVSVIKKYSDGLMPYFLKEIEDIKKLKCNLDMFRWLSSKNEQIGKFSHLVQYNIFMNCLIRAVEENHVVINTSPYLCQLVLSMQNVE